MNTNEAQTLVGRRVRVGMGADGIYVGEFLELQGKVPWRGRVRITGVLSPAHHLDQGAGFRRGYRPGEFIEVGRGHVAPTTAVGHGTYLAALTAELGRYVSSHSGYQTSQQPWVSDAMGRALCAALNAEAQRLSTGQWTLAPSKDIRPMPAED